jgi:hypothetical protein
MSGGDYLAPNENVERTHWRHPNLLSIQAPQTTESSASLLEEIPRCYRGLFSYNTWYKS